MSNPSGRIGNEIERPLRIWFPKHLNISFTIVPHCSLGLGNCSDYEMITTWESPSRRTSSKSSKDQIEAHLAASADEKCHLLKSFIAHKKDPKWLRATACSNHNAHLTVYKPLRSLPHIFGLPLSRSPSPNQSTFVSPVHLHYQIQVNSLISVNTFYVSDCVWLTQSFNLLGVRSKACVQSALY